MIKRGIYFAIFCIAFSLIYSEVGHRQKRKCLNKIILDYELLGIYSDSEW